MWVRVLLLCSMWDCGHMWVSVGVSACELMCGCTFRIVNVGVCEWVCIRNCMCSVLYLGTWGGWGHVPSGLWRVSGVCAVQRYPLELGQCSLVQGGLTHASDTLHEHGPWH